MKKSAALNHAYKLIWSEALSGWVAVSEHTKGKGKSKSQKLISSALGTVFMLGVAHVSLADPTGGQVTTGSASITQSVNTTTITQTTQNVGISWDSFNINVGETVNFIQPNATALAVNRIFDTNGSKIMGNLNANGQVWLINPNGVFFGAGSQVNVGSILASTLNPLSNTGDADQIFGNGGSGSVINQGNITAANGGYVAMLGNKVINEGVITAQMGTVALGAGSKVSLQFNGNKLLGLTVNESTLNNLAENKLLVKADGGLVFMSAGAKDSILASTVNNTGVIEAQTVQNQDGKIILMGGMTAGTTNVDGTLDASAATADNTGAADGGFIETSAAHVKVAENTVVTARAENGQAGTWLIDPTNYNIAIGGDQSGSQIATTLDGGTDVNIQTVAAGTDAGDINVNDSITWNSNNNLTLTAHNDININQSIDAKGATAKLALEYGQGAIAAGNNATYNVNAKVYLHAGDNFSTKLGNDVGVAATEYKVITELSNATNSGLQGINGNLAGNYVLGADIDASATIGWNAGKGFDPLGDLATKFTGTFDGLGHTVNNLTINRTSENYVGLFGRTNGASIQNIGVVGGTVIGNNGVGGLVGSNRGGSTISNAYATGAVSGGSYVGGLGGWNAGSTISNSYATGAVTGTGHSVGGLVGYNRGSTISNAYATGAVSGDDSVGGLVGDSVLSSTITNAYATGAVTGTSIVGGLVGRNVNSTISNAYATGAVTGSVSNVGGLVGYNYDSTITNSFWDTQTSGRATSNGGTGKTTTQMQTLSTFTDAGWDIDDEGGTGKIWRIYEGHTAPLLRSFMTQLDLTGNSSTTTYNGTTQSIAYTLPAGTDASLVLGSTSGKNAGTYNRGLYSTQQGYDIKDDSVLTIDKANATVNVTPYNTTYDGSAKTAAFTLAGVNGETGATVGVVDVSGTTHTNAGTYNDSWSFTGAANYNDIAATMITDVIAKATLTYVATPNTMTAGTTPNLTGNVTGFVGGESLASATTGALLWNTAGNTTQPGTYDIAGSGLSALNYDFVQDAANVTALTVQAGSIPQPILTTVNSALPSGNPAPAQSQVNTIDVNNPLTASGGEEGESGFINDPQSKSQVIDIVYNSCDPDKDCGEK